MVSNVDAKPDTSVVRQVLLDGLRTHFDTLHIVDVRVESRLDELDDDGDFFKVYVIFDGQAEGIDPGRRSSIARHLRPKLRAIGETAFPVFYFLTTGEAELAPA
jgi:hypothetical protein